MKHERNSILDLVAGAISGSTLLSLIACAASSTSPAPAMAVLMTYQSMLSLPFGSTRVDALKQFGAPTKKFVEEDESQAEVWSYQKIAPAAEDDIFASLTFDARGKLTGKTYSPRARDHFEMVDEFSNLTGAKLVAPPLSLCGGHSSGATQRAMFDVDKNISIERNVQGQIWSISWGPPLTEEQRKIASLPSGCPPTKRAKVHEIQ